MALNAAQQWWVRSGGSDTNGGGYDATISGAGTNYSDQDAAQLALSDVVTVSSTTVTSVTGGFTSAMIGNIIRIAGDGYYAITARASTNSISVDRNTGTATGQTAAIGGAFANPFKPFAAGGGGTAPALAVPIVPGNIVNVRGSGSANPGSADYTQASYYTTVSGDNTNGPIQWVGYNGRPFISVDGLTVYNGAGWVFRSLKFVPTAANFAADGIIFGDTGPGAGVGVVDCIVDMNGQDMPVVNGASHVVGNAVYNSGSTAAGIYPAFSNLGVLAAYNNLIVDVRGFAIDMSTNAQAGVVTNNVLARCRATGTAALKCAAALSNNALVITSNTIDGNASDGLSFAAGFFGSVIPAGWTIVSNNIFSNNGGYGINATGAVSAFILQDYNDFYLNTSGARNNVAAGANDLALDPQYTNAAANDFTIGTNLAAKGYPVNIGAIAGTASFVDMGSAQRQCTGGSSGGAWAFA